jgi:SPP1 gp7 family putative phage head morphogenesis protein
MDGTPYQPAPDGFWRQSPEHVLLWALTGAMHRIEREIPETKHVTRWQAKLEKAIYDAVRKFKWETLWTAKHVRKDDTKDPPAVPDDVAKAWETLPQLIADQLWPDAGGVRADALDLPFDPEDLQTGLDASLSMIKSIPETLHERLREVMRDSYDSKTGPQGFARAIRDEFRDVAKWKAEQIATTEWARAASTATLEGYKKQGVELKVWYTVGDERVCPACESNAADGEIGIDQTFFSGDAAPPAHPGCRCDISSA